MLNRIRAWFLNHENEKAEALPTAIVTAIVSSIVLLGLAGVVASLVNQQKDAQAKIEVTTTATNIEASLRTDTTSASSIVPTSTKNVAFHIPVAASGGNPAVCKVVTWVISSNTLVRDLTIYQGTINGANLQCDTTSPVVVNNTRTITTSLKNAPTFSYYNSLGRELAVNADGSISLKDASAAAPSSDASVVAAWNSTLVVKVGFSFTLGSSSGDVSRNVSQ